MSTGSPDVHDPAGTAADQGQEGLDHGHRSEQVDLELHPEVRHRLELKRSRLGDAGVVHETDEAAVADSLRHRRRRR